MQNEEKMQIENLMLSWKPPKTKSIFRQETIRCPLRDDGPPLALKQESVQRMYPRTQQTARKSMNFFSSRAGQVSV